VEQAGRLMQDPNGVIVMQWLLDSEIEERYKRVAPAVEAGLATLVGLRFASNLVSKILTQTSEPDVRDRSLNLLVKDPTSPASPIHSLLKEPTSIQIIGRILATAPTAQRLALVDALRSALPVMTQAASSSAPVHLTRLQSELRKAGSTSITFDLSHLIQSTTSPSNNSHQGNWLWGGSGTGGA